MDYSKLTTDQLIDKIVIEIGVPIPTYDYNYRKFISVVPHNISFGNVVKGIESADMHDNFRESCMRIIHWNEEVSNGR